MTSVTEFDNNQLLVEIFNDTRKRTISITKNLKPDDFVVQTEFFTSPIKWHIGHVSWIYEAIIGKLDENYKEYSKEFSKYLNSYYQQFGTPNDKGKRGIISRPTLEEVFQYFNTVNQRVISFMKSKNLDEEAKRLLTMGMHHECQHQELMAYDLQNLLADGYEPIETKSEADFQRPEKRAVQVEGGLYKIGYNGNGFCYDIEMPEHIVYLNDYKIESFPVTNSEYLEFIENDGYKSYKYWLSDGWEKVKKNAWEAPMYWEKIDGGWMKRDFHGLRAIDPNEPVCNVSYYEADAYCKWAGKRLPTEAEWEKAACWNPSTHQKSIFPWGNDEPTSDHANLLESSLWKVSKIGSYPKGKSPYGCYQMIGDVWEWTSSEFMGYPGFKTGFDEYNDKWFTNQKVLRGGSFATPKMSIRGSYRNFFRLDERWLFSGFRCVT